MDWKKRDKALYLPGSDPVAVKVPAFSFWMLYGEGNPNGEAFAEAVGVLYSLAYAVKMLPKKGPAPAGYEEYTVFPLEGVWDLVEEWKAVGTLNKDKLAYTLMIRQPEFVTPHLAADVLAQVKKKPHAMLDKVRFETLEEGLCVQMMHLGPYDDEPASFAKIAEFCKEQGLRRTSHVHREIYLSDARKTAPEKMKTVLRVMVE